ncbi:Probable siderophore transport system ATP-binding protein YusV [Fusobacterium polymorphum]|uniref:Iron (Fe3+) ABC superfamily ATP binding cassette transporter ABC protein n=1 Tax=Fusobacterium polymorphum ATCC 10953 TaxID=393480 RepID=A5TWG1_FUSNP|nr:ABC transporter ATP-binding protein [Fusobacterium polymorphum]EDK89236.1 iron (Fe3+) ABC superfamily ATP binding cassette transporter ABC protein [Fusobacterium polymorphum ATCC 10953]UTI52213.1 ABC transporter ATP-binding protein [Fusobacterium polymorphum]WRL68945.1 ABC transporter ATP-binding protein [Fusobacterium polymorphum]CKG98580.1 Probable siderophore transport system ATP-binding protein YusV [Fusobacterium polymorphum]
MEIINIKKLNYSYGKKEVLKELSLDIDKNKLTGIIGPNGCGKSTLAKNIIKYINGKFESFKIMDTDIRELTHKKIAQLISYIPQKSIIIPNISVFDYVLLGRFPLLKNSWDNYSEQDYEIVEKNINLLNIRELKDRNIETLSGGELQKALLARALAQEAKILLLDEPTSALDLNNAVEFMKILKNISIKKNISVIIIIHDLNLASLFCDSLIILKDGRFIEKGSPKEVINEENIKSVYNLDCKVCYNENDKPYIIPKT